MVTLSHCHIQAHHLHLHQQEPPLYLQQLHDLSICLLRLPLLNRRRHDMRLLRCPPRLLPDKGPLLGPQHGTLLLHLRLPLAWIHSLYLRYPHQHCRIRRSHWKVCATRCQIHLQHQLLRRFHRFEPDILHLVQDFSDSGMQREVDGGWRRDQER